MRPTVLVQVLSLLLDGNHAREGHTDRDVRAPRPPLGAHIADWLLAQIECSADPLNFDLLHVVQLAARYGRNFTSPRSQFREWLEFCTRSA